MQILKTDGSLLIDLPQFDTIKDAVEYCVKNKISLQKADLRGADLRQADLPLANLQQANLWLVDLQHANLQVAKLQGAKLQRANLQGANLRETNLHKAKLNSAITQHCSRFGHFSKVGGRSCFYYKPVESEALWLIQAGCFNGTLEEFEAACKAEYPNDPIKAYQPQIEYLKKILV